MRQTAGHDVLNALSAGVLLTDERWRISFANDSALSVIGISGEDCLGQDVERLLHLQLGARLKAGEERRCEAWFPDRNGAGETHLGITLRGYFSQGGELNHVLLFRPIANDSMPDEATIHHLERLAAIGQMVAGFAHEVRNPLAALRSLVEDLGAETAADDPRHEHVKRIRKVVIRLENLLRTSLQFGRPRQPARARHPVPALISSALDLLQPRLQQMEVERSALRQRVEELPDVFVDDGQIQQVLVILLNNALDATQNPSLVSVQALQSPHGAVLIEVADRGPGIPPEQLGQIFNAFFTTKDKGTGLGLSIALKLVRENGGQLTVRSKVGLGTTFTIELPSV